ncbi:two-component system chemotaxis sensor kinase CheA [Sedimentibacter acidaminivorans]|uniref:Chemotaxis protein CheA n=1 Tax=Sedimentibacter acidaminivorans TaxID=913099 RepID=A0ABS4GDD6_9FIRM|nr:chemotaxis protein CheA [Sedimentibacter acidaminivorans]MBP1925720.1 two-component system chemotaxis sensor kinase CheA [Sedimentibacter acidaminivorans]
MDNNLDSVLDMYLFEENTLLEQLDEILLKAESEQAFDKDCVDEIFRIMHTIKGSSAMMQFNSIMTISHKVEDLFYYIRENGVEKQYNERLVNLVFKFTDFIKGEISKIEQGEALEENLDDFEKEIHNFLQVISGEKSVEESSTGNSAPLEEAALTETLIESDTSTEKIYCIKIFFDDDCGMENLRAFFIVNQLSEMGVEFTNKPESVENNSEAAAEIVKDGFFVFLKDKDSLDAGIRVVKGALNVKNYTVIEFNDEKKSDKSLIKNNSVNENEGRNIKSQVKKAENKKNSEVIGKHNKQSLITVNLSKLDSLVDIVGEIVIAESMVSSNSEIKNLNLESFTKSSRQLRKLTDELQDIVMSLRMVPVSGIFQKMKRIVRDMGKELNKDVELVLIGEETEVDKTIVDGISDPIMHLVRNAMDHGMESTDERILKGKDPKGTIELSASNTGGEIHITVEDNGKGFDTEKILAKAKTKGLLQKPENEYSAKEIYQLLMLPGFSTNETVTEYSGRGVGMDVVKSNVEKVGGTVVLDSKQDKGTAITFKIPLTLAIVSGMQVVVGDSELIIPIKNIQQSFKVKSQDIIHNTDGQEMIILRDKCYPVVRLHNFFNIETNVTNIDDGILILVEAGENKVCLFVDKIIGEQQVVVKPLPTIFNKYKIKESGVSGCSILGDGSINLILDISSLIESL